MAGITTLRHPAYMADSADWDKYRCVYDSGRYFVDRYLEKFSTREDADDYARRKRITPIPSFAKTAINEVRNSIFQRMSGVVRSGGSLRYQEAVSGKRGGVDNRGRSMTSYLGQEILTEMLVIGKVGTYIDAPINAPTTHLGTDKFKPYMYTFAAENIINWVRADPEHPSEFQSIMLRESSISYDDQWGLPNGKITRFRHVWIDERTNLVNIQYLDADENPLNEPVALKMDRIPFVLFDLGDSVMKVVAEHQIALLNLWSSNIAYGLNSNFPFLTVQEDGRDVGAHLKASANSDGTATAGGQGSNDETVQVGNLKGRKYDLKAERPGFIHPSSEPLLANLKMCGEIKDEIRQLVSLAIADLGSRASAQSKEADNHGLEAGLSYIGLVLEAGEREIASHWATYEEAIIDKRQIATIAYPKRWSLKTDKQRVEEASALHQEAYKMPGRTVKRVASKILVDALVGSQVDPETLAKIHDEIDEANYTTSDPVVIQMARENGLLGDLTGVEALGFSKSEAKRAQDDHAAKLKAVQDAQTPVQGVNQSASEAKEQKSNEKEDARGVQGEDSQRGRQRKVNDG